MTRGERTAWAELDMVQGTITEIVPGACLPGVADPWEQRHSEGALYALDRVREAWGSTLGWSPDMPGEERTVQTRLFRELTGILAAAKAEADRHTGAPRYAYRLAGAEHAAYTLAGATMAGRGGALPTRVLYEASELVRRALESAGSSPSDDDRRWYAEGVERVVYPIVALVGVSL